jgi:lactoylglutathione lyase
MTKLSYTVIFASDMARSIAFYRDVLGIPLRFESPEWSEFETGSCTLALHKAAAGSVPPVEPGKMPAGHCHIGINVDDLDAFHAALIGRGVRCVQPPTMQDFGSKMAIYSDPDGLPVSVVGVTERQAST